VRWGIGVRDIWRTFILSRHPWTFTKCLRYTTDFFVSFRRTQQIALHAHDVTILISIVYVKEFRNCYVQYHSVITRSVFTGKYWPSFSVYCTWLQRASAIYGGHTPSAPPHCTATMIYWTGYKKFRGIPSTNSLGFIALRMMTDRSSVCYVAGYTTLTDV
jgi:hypothetical protein